MRKMSVFTFVLLLLLTSCVTVNLGPQETTPPAFSEIPPIIGQAATIKPEENAGLTLNTLWNSEFLSPLLNAQVKLVNGEFSGTVNETELHAVLQPNIQFGDLNGDGIDDAALLLNENTGGTGNFVSLIVIFSQGNSFKQAPGILIDDRPVINSMSIVDGKVIVDVLLHAPNDPMVNPTQAAIQEYSLIGENVFFTKLNTQLPGGSLRLINITSPLPGDEVGDSVTITGSMPIAPFENTLLLKIIDKNQQLLYSAGFMVQSADVGQPATFSNTITIPAISSGSTILLLLQESSMADGKPIAINTVELKTK